MIDFKSNVKYLRGNLKIYRIKQKKFKRKEINSKKNVREL